MSTNPKSDRLNPNPSPVYRSATNIIRKLAGSEGVYETITAIAEAIRPLLRQALRPGVRRANHACIWRLLGKPCDGPHDGEGVYCSPPGADHTTLWLRQGEPHLYEIHRFDISKEGIREFLAFSDHHGLDFRFVGASWYHPGRTFTVEIRRANG